MEIIASWLPAVFVLALLANVFYIIKRISAGNKDYQIGAAIALITSYLIFHIEAGVGINGPQMFLTAVLEVGVFTVGLVGALIARYKPAGMFKTVVAVTIAQCCAVFALIVSGAVPNAAAGYGEVILFNGIFILGYAVSAFFFWRSAPGFVKTAEPINA